MNAIYPNWQVPNNIHTLSTLRSGGYSCGAYAGMNLGDHVGDTAEIVAKNRQLLVEQFQLPQSPTFLTQIHSNLVKRLPLNSEDKTADACYSNQPNQVCLIMTADCLPVIFAAENGQEVAAAHAGWRGLANGILENTLHCFNAPADKIKVWLAPAISAKAFQVGQDVYDAFCLNNETAKQAFKIDDQNQGKYFADIYQLARIRLQQAGALSKNISGGEYCTYSDPEKFYSYRRDKITGRMATLIWFEDK